MNCPDCEEPAEINETDYNDDFITVEYWCGYCKKTFEKYFARVLSVGPTLADFKALPFRIVKKNHRSFAIPERG